MRRFAAEAIKAEQDALDEIRSQRGGGLSPAALAAIQDRARSQAAPKLGDTIHDGKRQVIHGQEGLDF